MDSLHARLNDPDVAKYQSWTTPVTRDYAETLIAGSMTMEGPENDEWWMAAVTDRETGEVYGDISLKLTWDSHCAEVGYNFGSRHWGNGYAVEAVGAVVDYLFETLQVTRAFATPHPENLASSMVLERTGFLHEGHTRNSYWLGGDNSDDWLYGQTPQDWQVEVSPNPVDGVGWSGGVP